MNLNLSFPIVDKNGMAADMFRLWIARRQPLTGAGSPEGVVGANLYRFYINTTGSPGSLLYIKVQSDIGGDKTQGWVAV